MNELCGLGAELAGGLALHEYHSCGDISGRDHGSSFSYIKNRQPCDSVLPERCVVLP